MQIKKGKDRIVVLLPSIGIVIKFPIIHIAGVFRLLRLYLRKRNRKHLRRNVRDEFKYSIDSMGGGIKGALLRGVVANWRELRFYQTTRHPFLQPTYFSLMGLLNVQRYGASCTQGGYRELWVQMLDLTEGGVWDDNHHFCNPDNFCLRDGKLRMVDYGCPKGYSVILQYGTKILEEFDVTIQKERSEFE